MAWHKKENFPNPDRDLFAFNGNAMAMNLSTNINTNHVKYCSGINPQLAEKGSDYLISN